MANKLPPKSILKKQETAKIAFDIAGAVVDSSFLEFLKTQEELASRGYLTEAMKSLEDGLAERSTFYPSTDQGIWLISKMLVQINMKMAVKALDINKLEKANQFLKQARKFSEPLPASQWDQSPDWMNIRKNVYKNYALFF